MKNLLRKVTSILVAFVITLSTSGFMVFVHHCHHHQETMASLFFNFNDQLHHTCQAGSHSHATPPKEAPEEFCMSGCCEDVEFLVKISPDTEPVKSGSKKLRPQEVPSTGLVIPVDLAESFPVLAKSRDTGLLKIPISGRQLLIRFHQLKEDCSC